METKQITLTYNELDDIVFALLQTWCDTDIDKYPALYDALSKTHKKMFNIEKEWRKERKEGAK